MNTARVARRVHADPVKPRFQHRPQPRRQTTRRAATMAALREA